MRARNILFALLLGLLAPLPAAAVAAVPPPVPIEAGIHRGFSRLVFDFPRWVGWRMARHGDAIRLRFSATLPFGSTPKLPPGILALRDRPGWVEVTVAHGARVRRMHVGLRRVLDVFTTQAPPLPLPPSPLVSLRGGPPRQIARAGAKANTGPGGTGAGGPGGQAPAAMPGAAKPTALDGPATASKAAGKPTGPAAKPPATPAATPPATPARSARPVRPTLAAAPGPAPGPNQAIPIFGPRDPPGPVALAARPATPPRGSPGAMLVPFESGVGAAAFRRAGEGVVVFDAPRPIDLSALAGTHIFGKVTVRLLAAGTELRMPLPPGIRLALSRKRAGWLVALAHAVPPAVPIRPLPAAAGLALGLPDPGRPVSLLDPETGAPLLVGTERAAPAAMAVSRAAPQFALLRSWRGVVIEALSDRLALRAVPSGFLLTAKGGLAITPAGPDSAALADAALLTRRFHFPDLGTTALADRLRRQMRAAAARPPLARGPRLRAAAETMIALGMGAEAHALLHLAAEQDPREAARPIHAGLAAVAAMLAGKPAAAGAIASPRLSGSDEVAFWQAVRLAQTDPRSARAAQLFAATAPLALAYPRALRRAVLPLAAETMIQGRETRAGARLLARRPHDPRLALAHAMLDAARGRSDDALMTYDRLSDSPDRLVRFRAATRAVALRLAAHAIGPARAAHQLNALRDAWRGGPRELHLLRTLAGLRARAGQWTRALALLRRTIHDFPHARAALRAQMRRLFATALADPRLDQAPPLQYVAFVNANADLLPKGKAGLSLAGKLANRLLALDLPDRAAPLLARLARDAPTPATRAGFGARLAALRLDQGDAKTAAAVLAATAAPGLPAPLALRRAILAARVDAAQGHAPEAEAALLGLASARADAAAAAIAAHAGDWKGAAAALSAQKSRAIPPAGALTDPQRQLLLRLATARVRARDRSGLARLRAEQARMGTGALANLFRLLTAPGMHSQDQIARAGSTATLAAGLGDALKAVR